MNYNIEDSEWKEFREKHRECELTATIRGKFSFIFTPTGLGPIVEVRCNKCGKQEDITNYDIW